MEEDSEDLWQVRVCPILFEDFCKQRNTIATLMNLSHFFEYRMSRNLSSKVYFATYPQMFSNKDIPFLPNEKTYSKPQNAATAGMLQMKVPDSSLVELITIIRSTDMSKSNRIRFELKRLPNGNMNQIGGNATSQNEANTQKDAMTGDTAEAGRGQMKEERQATPLEEMNSDQIQINFSVRLKPVKEPAFQHEQGYILKPADKQLFLTKVPDKVPDNVLEAIMMSDMVDRKMGVNNTGTATFTIKSPLGAQGFMELYDGILIDMKNIEMSTSLGTLYDARKKHAKEQQANREANAQEIKTLKRKTDSGHTAGQDAKRFRGNELSATSQMGMPGRVLTRGRIATQRGAQGTIRGPGGKPVSRAGLLGRGMTGAPPGGRGMVERGALRGRGQATERGMLQGAPRAVHQGSGRAAVRGGIRGAPPRGDNRPLPASPGRPMEHRMSVGVLSDRPGPGFGGGYQEMARERDMRPEFAALGREEPFRGDRFSPRRAPERRMDRYDRYVRELEYGHHFQPPVSERW